jgi:hypothetical protein
MMKDDSIGGEFACKEGEDWIARKHETKNGFESREEMPISP